MSRYCFKYPLLVMVSLISLSGCATFAPIGDAVNELFSSNDNAEPPAVLTDYKAEIKLTQLWDYSDTVGTDELSLNLVPAVANGRIIVADREGLVQARDRKDGHLLWEAETQLNISSGPVIHDNMLWVASSNAEVLALNATTGKALWKQKVSSEVLALPVVVDDTVFIRSIDGQAAALNKKDGHLLWSVTQGAPILSIRGEGAPISFDEMVIFTHADGKLTALNKHDGAYIWEATVASPRGRTEIERLCDLNGTPILIDSTAFVSSYKSGMTAISVIDGDILWRNSVVSSLDGLSADSDYLYISDVQSHVWQLDQRNGASYWKQTDLHHRQLSIPAVYGDYVVVGDFEGYVHWLSKTDGRLLARIKITDEAIAAQPVVVDDVVYIYAVNGTLAAVKALLF